MIVVMDTEATELLAPEASDINLQPHIMEFAGIKLDKQMNEVERISFLVTPPISVPPEVIKITGLMDEMLKDAGALITHMSKLQKFFVGSEILVAHNASYDVGVLSYELQRLGLQNKFPWPPRHICTVESTMQIRGYRLNLAKLHEHLFNQKFEGAHRALADTEALLKCFRKLVDDGEIVL